MPKSEDVIIVGGGPAGYTAAVYTARANLSPLVIEGFMWGGQLQQTTEVENYPGFPEGVMGPQLMVSMREQAERFGARFLTDDVTAIEAGSGEGAPHTVRIGDEAHLARAVILTTGAEHKTLGVRGEGELASGLGVSYCATCDAAFYRDAETIIVGGGDTAMEEAIFLAKFASKVTVVHRRDEFRASRVMLDRARSVSNIEWLIPYHVEEFLPGDQGALRGARLRHAVSGDTIEISARGAFVAVGHEPQSSLVGDLLELDENGYVLVEGRTTRTAVAGIFAGGDLVDSQYRQAVTAAGSGCQCALDAERYLRDTPIAAASETVAAGAMPLRGVS